MKFSYLKRLHGSQKALGNIWRNGFSLVELLVVISVIVIMTAIFVTYSHKSDGQIVFFNDSSLVFSTILRAKASSLATFQPTQFPPWESAEHVCGWGIHFERGDEVGGVASSIVLFRDIEPGVAGKRCDFSAGNLGKYGAPPDTDFETFTLSSIVRIRCIAVDPVSGCDEGSSLDDADAIFVPPDPRTLFSANGVKRQGVNELLLVVGLADRSRCAEIYVNAFGQVSRNDIICP